MNGVAKSSVLFLPWSTNGGNKGSIPKTNPRRDLYGPNSLFIRPEGPFKLKVYLSLFFKKSYSYGVCYTIDRRERARQEDGTIQLELFPFRNFWVKWRNGILRIFGRGTLVGSERVRK